MGDEVERKRREWDGSNAWSALLLGGKSENKMKGVTTLDI